MAREESINTKLKMIMITDFFEGIDNYTPIFAVNECNKEGMDISLDIYGNGKDLEKIKNCIKNQNCDNIKHRENFFDSSLYGNYDIFVAASDYYETKIRTKEALKAGLPLILLDINDNNSSEFIYDNGFIAPQNNIMHFRKILKEIYDNKNQLEQMGKNSKTVYEKHFALNPAVNNNDNKIKITHVTRYAYPHIGGIEAVINQINSCLPNNEFEKEVICCSNTDKSSVENGIKYNRARYLFEIFNNTISLSFLWKLSRVKTDVLHYHMPFIFAVICHFIARPKYKKLYITYHAEIKGYDNIMKYFWKLYKYFYKISDKIHVLAPNVIYSDKILTPFKDKCYVLPFGIGIKKENSLEESKFKTRYKDKKILLCIGRLVKIKGFQYVIQAMNNVDNAILIIIGSGEYKQELVTLINNLNLQDKVIILDEIADKNEKNDILKACDVFILPSTKESFAIVQLEAMVHGKPVINTNLGTGVTFVSVDKQTGLTVEPENVEQLTDAINKLLQDDELHVKYGNNAKKRVEELFNLEDIKYYYSKLYL